MEERNDHEGRLGIVAIEQCIAEWMRRGRPERAQVALGERTLDELCDALNEILREHESTWRVARLLAVFEREGTSRLIVRLWALDNSHLRGRRPSALEQARLASLGRRAGYQHSEFYLEKCQAPR